MRKPARAAMLAPVLAAVLLFGVIGNAAAQNPASLARIDINRAPAQLLQRLHGIDAARAQAIIAGRPYRRTEELVDKGIIPADVFEGLKVLIYAGPAQQ